MSMLTVRLTGRQKILMDRKVMRAALSRSAKTVAKDTRRGLRGSGSGRRYTKQGRTVQASTPGEYPARFSGNLSRSVRQRVRLDTAIVKVMAPHTHFLFLGTSNMAPRKDVLSDMLEARSPEIEADLLRALADAMP